MIEFHPVLPLISATLLMPLVARFGGGVMRRMISVVAPLAALAAIVSLPDDASKTVVALGHEFQLLQMGRMSRLFAFAFALYGAMAGLYAWSDRDGGAKPWSMLLVVGGVGTSLAGDWLSLFLFWEMLSLASIFLVWIGRDPQSQAAGFRYAMFHMAGGVVLLGGVLWQVNTGDASVGPLDLSHGASWAILIGLLTNAAVPPLHAWLPDAYPRASIFGSVFLAAFTTKSAVYVLAQAFPGATVLAYVGAAMTIYGAVFAILENDIRRLLAYHIISQVGYMVAGVGIGSALAVNGASAHAFCNIFYKGLLFMAAGAVIHATGRGKLTELGNLARPLRWTFAFMLIGGVSISGFPLFNGFVSKAMVISSSIYAHLGAVELLLVIASIGTFLSVGLKLPWFAFCGPDHGAKVKRPVPRTMFAAMALASALCIYTGLPGGFQTLYHALPTPTLGQTDPKYQSHDKHAEGDSHDAPDAAYAHDHPSAQGDEHAASATAASATDKPKVHAEAEARPEVLYYPPFTPDHIVGSLQLLVGTGLGFWLLRKVLKPKPKVSLDVDRLYRGPIAMAVEWSAAAFQALGRAVEGGVYLGVGHAHEAVKRGRAWGDRLSIAHQLAVIVGFLAIVAYLAFALAA